MLITFDQVKEWITDNNLKRWMLYKDYTCKEKFLDSNAFPGDMPDKIAMTEKYLYSVANGKAYARGGVTAGANDLDMCAEIRLQDVQPLYSQNIQGVGGGMDANVIGQLRDEITRSVRAEIEAASLKDREKEITRREKEFAEKEAGVWGLIVNKLGPAVVGKILNNERMVAGVDTEKPVHADPIIVNDPENKPTDTPKPEDQEEQSPFTDEEADELFALLARFKKAEPEYLTMIRKVVEMAENGDANYQFARKALL